MKEIEYCKETWLQGNWNAWVVFGCDENQSRERCKKVPMAYRNGAISHARTYWKIQANKPNSVKRKPKSGWIKIEITKEHWEAGIEHLQNSNWQRMHRFGDQQLGFAAERAVADWFADQDIDPHYDPDPTGTRPDYSIHGLIVDLKSVSTKGRPQGNFDANLAERQRLQDDGKVDWYLFGKHDNRTEGDFYILGFQTEEVIMSKGVFYVQGEITRRGMPAPVDCWCIAYDDLVKPWEWLENENPD